MMRLALLALSTPAIAANEPLDMARWLSSLLIVLAVVFVLGAVAKRIRAQGFSGNQRVVDSISLGMRERILVLEMAGQYYVLGVTAQQITLLDKRDSWPVNDTPQVAELLKKWTSKREKNTSAD